MSNVPKLRFKEFSGDWETHLLGKSITLYDNKRKPVKEQERNSGEYAYYGATGIIDYIDSYIFEGEYLLLGEDGANIVTRNAPLIYKTEGQFWVNNHAHIFKPKSKFDIDFMKQRLELINYIPYNTGTAQPKLNADSIKSILFNSPSKEEQEKIASFFSLIDDKISLQGEKLEMLKDYKTGMMQKIFSRELRFKDNDGRDYPDWEEKKLGDLVETITDYVAAGSFESIRNNVKYFDTPSHAQLVRTVDLKHKFNNKNFVYVDKNAFDFLYRVNLNKECIILPNIGANIGESYFIKPELLPHEFNVLAPNAILLYSDKNNNSYIYYLLNTREFHKQLDCMVGASGQPKFNKTELKQMKFKVASLDEQNKICNILERLDLKIDKEQAKLDYLNEYKKGLLQQMFV